jgi:hypothetical protein
MMLGYVEHTGDKEWQIASLTHQFAGEIYVYL